MSTMPQNQNSFIPRKGQQDLIKFLPGIKLGDQLSVQWATGYGKSIGFALTWKHCHEKGMANRLLMVVANDTQREQIKNDFAGDCELVGAPCAGGIWVFERSGSDLVAARDKSAEVFVCTVQALDASYRGGVNVLRDMLRTKGTKWMIGFDEYHHYGEDMSWGNAAKSIMHESQFTMAMTATPYRRGTDVIFPKPDLVVPYKQAVEEGCVKRMLCHSYDYKVTVITDGEPVEYLTQELMEKADGKVDIWEERNGIRYSPHYIQPLISEPITRLGAARTRNPGVKLQMLVRALSCRHAQLLCEQFKVFAEGLTLDWIGTGKHGRSDAENKRILKAFCPPKKDGVRAQPTLDILIQVAMAGEGYDSINVCEIVDLYPVSKQAKNGNGTRDKQFYGRGARVISGARTEPCIVNIPTDHPLNAWGGQELHGWIDGEPGKPKDRDGGGGEFDLFNVPPAPKAREIALQEIIRESQHYQVFAKNLSVKGYKLDMNDPAVLTDLDEAYRGCMVREAEKQSAQAHHAHLREAVDFIAGRLALVMAKSTEEISGAVIGRFKKHVNQTLIKRFGKERPLLTTEELTSAYEFLKNVLLSYKK